MKKCALVIMSIVLVVGMVLGIKGADIAKAEITYEDIEQFPDSYKQALYALKEKHPNWTFEVMNTGLDWSMVLYNEMNPAQRSLVPSYFQSDFVGDYYGDGWSYATQTAVEYYMDPRNWLTEEYIFQFEKLTYNGTTQGIATVQKVLQNTFMSSFIQSDAKNDYTGMGLTYAKVFYDIGNYIGVSPVHLATRVKQEQGTQGTSDLISGTYPGYEGYYNYYNIQASGSTHEQIVVNGLNEAKSEGWDTRYGALLGGSQKIASRYILRGQDTLYLQKFDVDGAYDGRYWHQYMQNLAAPSNEGRNIKKAYESVGMLDEAFVFKIPVYNNMPKDITNGLKYAERMYKYVLGREGTETEYKSWARGLVFNDLGCAEMAYEFIFSDEYKNQNTNNSQYVKMLYTALLRREPSDAEIQSWTSLIESGYSRKYVLAQFTSSAEFNRIWSELHLNIGNIVVKEDEVYDITDCAAKYVSRLYVNVLGRECSYDERQSWVNGMLYNKLSCAEVAYQFIFSSEYTDKHTDNDQYVRMLYLTLLRRNAGDNEVQVWTQVLENGYSRKYVLQSFVSSGEFNSIWSSYHLNVGSIKLNDNEIFDITNNVKKYVGRMYNGILERTYSESEEKSWADGMMYDGLSCAEVAYRFIFSEEYTNRNTSNEQFLRMLYLTLLRREPQNSEIQTWLQTMASGYSRKYVLMQFTASDEFNRIWSEWHLNVGSIIISDDEIYVTKSNAQKYVDRLYNNILGRLCSEQESQSWVNGILYNGETCAGMAYKFIFSGEYTSMNTTNTSYINMLYNTLLMRIPTDEEILSWESILESGYTRKYVLQQITSKDEFIGIWSGQHLPVGEIVLSDEDKHTSSVVDASVNVE